METAFALGQTVAVDGWSWPMVLEDAAGYADADYRLTLPTTHLNVPVRVVVTGRKVRWEAPIKGGGVRVRIEILDDDDDVRKVGAWMSWEELSGGTVTLNPRGV